MDHAAGPSRETEPDHYLLPAENAADVVIALDDALQITWVSASCSDALGWESADLLGRTSEGFFHPDDLPRRAQTYEQLRAHGRAEGRGRIRRRDGAYTWMASRLRPLPDGGYVLALRVIDDEVLARAETEAALTELAAKEERLRATVDSMLDPHMLLETVWDEHGELVDLVYLEVNQAAADYLGVPAVDAVGRRMTELFAGEGVRIILSWCRDAMSTMAPAVHDDVTMTSSVDGMPRRLDVRAVPVGGRVSLTWRDQTQRHRERELTAERLTEAQTELYDWMTRFRLLSDHQRDAVVRLRRGVVEWVSPSLTATFGIAADAWMGASFTTLVHGLVSPGPSVGYLGPWPQHLGPVRGRLTDGDGLPRLVEVVAERYPHGSVVVTITDITLLALKAGTATAWLAELSPMDSRDHPAPALGDSVVAVLHLQGLAMVGVELGPQALEETWRELRRRLVSHGVPAAQLRRRDSEIATVVAASSDDPLAVARAERWVEAVAEPVETAVGVANCLLYVGLAAPSPGESVSACTQRAITALLRGVAAQQPITVAADPT